MALDEVSALKQIIGSDRFFHLIWDSQIAAALCFQFGDSGKGKIAALLSLWADFTVRGTGTDNAGHTSYVNGKKVITHYIPASIFYDNLGKYTILGSGMGINLESLLKEMTELGDAGITFNNMYISQDASVILPVHIMKDQKNKSMKQGSASSTGKGTTPVYVDRIGRVGVFLRDMFNVDVFREKLEKAYEFNGIPLEESERDRIIETQMRLFEKIKHMVRDTREFTHALLTGGRKMLIEGAQGTMLSIAHGTYGYTTSSDPTIYGSAIGCDIKPEDVDIVFGLLKFPIMTRVGNGPFPSEFGGKRSELHCAEEDGKAHTREKEEKEYAGITPKEMIASGDDFLRGIGWRRLMDEYGATTGRPRRTGRVDAVMARYAININSGNSWYIPGTGRSKRRIVLVSTKSDCAAGMGGIEICVGYNYDDIRPFVTSSRTYHPSKDVDYLQESRFTTDSELLYKSRGVYTELAGFDGDISSARNYEDLPENLKNMHKLFESIVNAKFGIISIGPKTSDIVLAPVGR